MKNAETEGRPMYKKWIKNTTTTTNNMNIIISSINIIICIALYFAYWQCEYTEV